MSRLPPAPGNLPTRERGCLAPFLFLLLLTAGGSIFWGFFYGPIATYVAARQWTPTPCQVYFVNELDPTADKRTPKERPSLRYRYNFGGTKFTSARVWFFKPDVDELESMQKQYPEGEYTCYVNPQDPHVAVLDRNFRAQFLVAIFPLTLALIGLIGLAAQFRRHTVERFLQAQGVQRPIAGPDGRVIRRKGRGFGMFLAVLLFAVAYNGVMYFLVREVVQSWSEGLPDCHGLFLTGFAIPFIAVGVGAVTLAGYLFLKLFNPRPTLTLSKARLAPGDTIEISWHCAGRTRRIRRLRIVVEGREEATYARGAKFYTDRELFTSIELLSTRDPKQMPRGKLSFTMPATAVPTFRSDNNSVSWVVRIHGHVRRWPDVDNELELSVAPAGEAVGAEVRA
jgi:hypothetical protein